MNINSNINNNTINIEIARPEKKAALKLDNSKGNVKQRISFTALRENDKYFIASSNFQETPNLNFFKRQFNVLLHVKNNATNESGYIAVNKNSLMKRLEIDKGVFKEKIKEGTENFTKFINEQIQNITKVGQQLNFAPEKEDRSSQTNTRVPTKMQVGPAKPEGNKEEAEKHVTKKIQHGHAEAERKEVEAPEEKMRPEKASLEEDRSSQTKTHVPAKMQVGPAKPERKEAPEKMRHEKASLEEDQDVQLGRSLEEIEKGRAAFQTEEDIEVNLSKALKKSSQAKVSKAETPAVSSPQKQKIPSKPEPIQMSPAERSQNMDNHLSVLGKLFEPEQPNVEQRPQTEVPTTLSHRPKPGALISSNSINKKLVDCNNALYKFMESVGDKPTQEQEKKVNYILKKIAEYEIGLKKIISENPQIRVDKNLISEIKEKTVLLKDWTQGKGINQSQLREIMPKEYEPSIPMRSRRLETEERVHVQSESQVERTVQSDLSSEEMSHDALEKPEPKTIKIKTEEKVKETKKNIDSSVFNQLKINKNKINEFTKFAKTEVDEGKLRLLFNGVAEIEDNQLTLKDTGIEEKYFKKIDAKIKECKKNIQQKLSTLQNANQQMSDVSEEVNAPLDLPLEPPKQGGALESKLSSLKDELNEIDSSVLTESSRYETPTFAISLKMAKNSLQFAYKQLVQNLRDDEEVKKVLSQTTGSLGRNLGISTWNDLSNDFLKRDLSKTSTNPEIIEEAVDQLKDLVGEKNFDKHAVNFNKEYKTYNSTYQKLENLTDLFDKLIVEAKENNIKFILNKKDELANYFSVNLSIEQKMQRAFPDDVNIENQAYHIFELIENQLIQSGQATGKGKDFKITDPNLINPYEELVNAFNEVYDFRIAGETKKFNEKYPVNTLKETAEELPEKPTKKKLTSFNEAESGGIVREDFKEEIQAQHKLVKEIEKETKIRMKNAEEKIFNQKNPAKKLKQTAEWPEKAIKKENSLKSNYADINSDVVVDKKFDNEIKGKREQQFRVQVRERMASLIGAVFAQEPDFEESNEVFAVIPTKEHLRLKEIQEEFTTNQNINKEDCKLLINEAVKLIIMGYHKLDKKIPNSLKDEHAEIIKMNEKT